MDRRARSRRGGRASGPGWSRLLSGRETRKSWPRGGEEEGEERAEDWPGSGERRTALGRRDARCGGPAATNAIEGRASRSIRGLRPYFASVDASEGGADRASERGVANLLWDRGTGGWLRAGRGERKRQGERGLESSCQAWRGLRQQQQQQQQQQQGAVQPPRNASARRVEACARWPAGPRTSLPRGSRPSRRLSPRREGRQGAAGMCSEQQQAAAAASRKSSFAARRADADCR